MKMQCRLGVGEIIGLFFLEYTNERAVTTNGELYKED